MIVMAYTVEVLFEYQNHLYYMYTGNHRDQHWNRISSQMIARMNKDGKIEKFLNL